MLVGAHVSPAGGLPKAIERGEALGCRAIQIFNQSPRAWRPTNYKDADIAAFREAMAASNIDAVLIHAVYLLNCASQDKDIRAKSLMALIHALNVGAAIGASGVVLHPGSALKGSVDEAIKRAGDTIGEALAATSGCDLHLEDTAGAGGTLGRSFEELAALIDAAGGGKRLGICLDSCHLLASGYDVRTAAGLTKVLKECDKVVGLKRLGSLHVNDSMTPLGSNRDRHAPLGTGELGDEGCAAFLSDPKFEGLACIFEGPGFGGKAAEPRDIEAAMKLRARGQKARKKR
jgi:deoxyribonuclease-4